MKDLFHVIDDAQIILRSKGVFYQKKLYRRGDRIYAAMGTGFIRIGSGDATSAPNVSWETMDLPPGVKLAKGKLGEPLWIEQEAA